VVVTTPTLVLRPLQAAQPGAPPDSASGDPQTPGWLDTQLRQHLPRARPLASTLHGLAARLNAAPAGALQSGTPGAGASAANGSEAGTPEAGARASAAETVARHNSPGPLARQLSALLAALPDTGALTSASRLAQSLQQSGLWLESLLAQGSRHPGRTLDLGQDLKAQLLRLSHELAQPGAATPSEASVSATDWMELSPKELAREVDAMLKQIVSLQLQSREAAQHEMRWLLELPFRNGAGVDSLHADIRRSASRPGEEEVWTMQLHLNLPQLGPLRIRLSWRNQRLSASLVAERDEGAERLRSHLDELRARFAARDLDVAGVHAGQGSVGRRPQWHGPLLNEQA